MAAPVTDRRKRAQSPEYPAKSKKPKKKGRGGASPQKKMARSSLNNPQASFVLDLHGVPKNVKPIPAVQASNSKYLGVYKYLDKWESRLYLGKGVPLLKVGVFDTEHGAGVAYARARRKYRGN